MPLSRPDTIPEVINFVWMNNIQSILDIGVGFGGNGVLFRQTMDVRWGRVRPEEWTAILDGIEINEEYNTHVWDVYNEVIIADIEEELFKIEKTYELIFFGDVLEHFPKEVAKKLIYRALELAPNVIVTTPQNFASNEAEAERFHNPKEEHQCVLEDKDFPTGSEITKCGNQKMVFIRRNSI